MKVASIVWVSLAIAIASHSAAVEAALQSVAPPQEGTAESWIKLLAKDPKDEKALRGIRSLDPSELTHLLKLASQATEPASYERLAGVIRAAMQDSLDSAIERLQQDAIAKKKEWGKDESLFRKHTRKLLVQANFLADLLVFNPHQSAQVNILAKIGETLAIETDPHPIGLYGELVQCKVMLALGSELDGARRGIATEALKTLEAVATKPNKAEELKECDVDSLRSAFERFTK